MKRYTILTFTSSKLGWDSKVKAFLIRRLNLSWFTSHPWHWVHQGIGLSSIKAKGDWASPFGSPYVGQTWSPNSGFGKKTPGFWGNRSFTVAGKIGGNSHPKSGGPHIGGLGGTVLPFSVFLCGRPPSRHRFWGAKTQREPGG